MKKIFSITLLLLCIMAVTGCGKNNSDEKSLNEFAVKFGELVQRKDLNGIREVYPNAGSSFSPNLTLDIDRHEIFPEGDNKYKIKFGGGSSITVRMGLNGAIEVLSSDGIFSATSDVVASEDSTPTESIKSTESRSRKLESKPAPAPEPRYRSTVFSDGYNVLNGSFNYQGAEYGFIVTFNYDSATGKVSNAMYEATGYGGGGAKNKINSMTISNDDRKISITGPGLKISASGSNGYYSGSMKRGTHGGTCTMSI